MTANIIYLKYNKFYFDLNNIIHINIHKQEHENLE